MRRFFHLIIGTTLVLTPLPAIADTTLAEEILMNGTLGGTRGLRLRQIGASGALHSTNADFVYYPASSIKVLQHLYGMRLVQDAAWNLSTTTGLVCDTDGARNCGPSLNGVAGCGATPETVDDMLRRMMQNSSNHHTNAVQELVGRTIFPSIPLTLVNMAHFGRLAINGFAQNHLDMHDTAINHKFGCAGFCGNPNPNTLTLRDIEKLYRAIGSDPDMLSPQFRVVLHDLMPNETTTSVLDEIIDEEAEATGRNQWKEAFRDKVYEISKGGNWTCSGKLYRSSAGLIQLPTHNGAHKRLYTWGLFAHDTEAWAYIPGTIGNSVRELLRGPVRAALLTWGASYQPAQTLDRISEALSGLRYTGTNHSAKTDTVGTLRLARDALAGENKDFHNALRLIRAAHDGVTGLYVDDEAHLIDKLAHLLEAGEAAALDALALAQMTNVTEPSLAASVAQIEAAITRGRQLATTNDGAAALDEFADAASRAGHLIDWSSRGPSGEEEDIGFVRRTSPLPLIRDPYVNQQ